MKWTSTLSELTPLEDAFREAAAEIRKGLKGEAPDLTVVFLSQHHAGDYERLPDLFEELVGSGLLVGCSAGGVIGGGHEVENRAGLSITSARLPGVELHPFHLSADSLPEPGTDAGVWEQLLGVGADAAPHFLLIPDPFGFDAEHLVRELDRVFPASRKVGGLASGGGTAGENALFLGDEIYNAGLVGLALSGDLAVDTIVAQGCRPIGEPMFVTRSQQHFLFELDGRPARDVLQSLYESLGEADRNLFRGSLFLGIVMRDHQESYAQGDFLIRNIMGVDTDSGALAVAANLRDNSVVQFHLRDARTSAQDLDELLARFHAQEESSATEGALIFSCLGRGSHLYGRPDHDTDAFRKHLGSVPLGGFFCNGEIGPVHGATFLHGYTSSFGLFRRRK